MFGREAKMNTTHGLTRHRDIQNWVTARHGSPAIAYIRDRFGDEKSKLLLRFHRRDKADFRASTDSISPCSWTAWLAELDRQRLMLVVDPSADDCKLVQRKDAPQNGL
jgi:hypothetical protein